jgi:hypothetical protein
MMVMMVIKEWWRREWKGAPGSKELQLSFFRQVRLPSVQRQKDGRREMKKKGTSSTKEKEVYLNLY